MSRLLVCLLVLSVPAGAAAQTDPWLGQRVFTKPDAKPKRGETAVDRKLLDFPATVGDVKGDWLWLGRAWVKKTEVMGPKAALKFYTEEIGKNPKSAAAWCARAVVWQAQGNVDNAIEDYSEAIRIEPNNATTYSNRGAAYNALGAYDEAIRDRTEAIKLKPNSAAAYNNRGDSWYYKGDYDRAIDDYIEAIRIDPQDGVPFVNLAWLHATCPNDELRDGKQALLYANQANELLGGRYAVVFDVTAAAYAESGDFAKAVEYQTKALSMAQGQEKEALHGRLVTYNIGQPYRSTKPR